MDYKELLENSFKMVNIEQAPDALTRLEYLSDYIFNFTTYEQHCAEVFAKKALEVCRAITEKKTFEYISDDKNKTWYLLMVNFPFFSTRLDWGGSTRGAWWSVPSCETDHHSLDSCGIYVGEKQETDLKIPEGEWGNFILAMLEFAEPEMVRTAIPEL